jgi:phosphoenolpyruvate carboxylase
VRLLGELLGETLRRDEGIAHYERVERVRALAKRTRTGASGDDFEALGEELRGMPVEAVLPVARSFAHFLNLANIAEQHHPVRRRREYERAARGTAPAGVDRGSAAPVAGRGNRPGSAIRGHCGCASSW